jgi:hypothetical protein
MQQKIQAGGAKRCLRVTHIIRCREFTKTCVESLPRAFQPPQYTEENMSGCGYIIIVEDSDTPTSLAY